jgi:PTH1 family peptidyl-tRNA hydrolase
VEDGRLVVGLGNPEARYDRTRHNIGFAVVDELHSRAGGRTWQEKYQGMFSRVDIAGRPALLLKPMTYMNLSGKSVSRAARYHRIEPPQVIVIHDDIDLPFETVRVKQGGGTGGHKGIASCVADLGSREFLRVRVGIGRPARGDATDHVLSTFSTDEEAVIKDVVAEGADAVETVIRHGVVRAMNRFNKREGGRHES